jgi:Spy/CpxP family protein refolding chaperone
MRADSSSVGVVGVYAWRVPFHIVCYILLHPGDELTCRLDYLNDYSISQKESPPMKNRGKITFALLALVIGALAITACGHRHHGPEQRAEWMMQRMTDYLDLNEDQQAKLRAIKDEFESGMKQYHQKGEQLFDRLAAEIEGPKLDKNLLMEMVETRKQAFDEIAPQVIDKVIDFHASLNAEQKKKLADKMEHFREHFKERHAG